MNAWVTEIGTLEEVKEAKEAAEDLTVLVRCTRLLALIAVKNVKFHLSLLARGLFIAGTVIRNENQEDFSKKAPAKHKDTTNNAFSFVFKLKV